MEKGRIREGLHYSISTNKTKEAKTVKAMRPRTIREKQDHGDEEQASDIGGKTNVQILQDRNYLLPVIPAYTQQGGNNESRATV